MIYATASFVLIIIGFIITPVPEESASGTADNKNDVKIEKESNTQKEVNKPRKVADPLKENTLNTKKKKEEPKIDPDAEKKNNKDLYVNKVKTEIDDVMGIYDRIWSDIWVPTFTRLSKNEISQLDAYQNMEKIKIRYDALSQQIMNIKVPNDLPKEDKKKIESFKDNLSDAATIREVAAKDAAKMIDKADFAPSKVTDLEKTVKSADSYLLKAVANISEIEMKYGVKRK